MAIDEVDGQAWARHHDDPAIPVVPAAPRTLYPRSLADLIEICSTRTPTNRIHAAGSHWALSTAAISDSVFVETHDPNENHQVMGRTLYEVVPPCLNSAFVDALAGVRVLPYGPDNAAVNQGFYPIHIETGKRVYQLYAELDNGDDNPSSLARMLANPPRNNPSYLGPWAFATMGGAGGQTVFGALTTGTHGGDFTMPPIADSVLAVHLVADGGNHYWIEPFNVPGFSEVQLTDDAALQGVYGGIGAPGSFQIIRDDDTFNAVLVSAGRFGIVYSIVIAAVRQYSLHQERRLSTWSQVKGQIADLNSQLYTHQDQSTPPPNANRFLQVAINVPPIAAFTDNEVGITKRWNVPLFPVPGMPDVPAGRPERRGTIVETFSTLLQAPRFDLAGNSFAYDPDPNNPGATTPPSFMELACTNANFLIGVLEEGVSEIGQWVASNGVAISVTIAAVIAVGGGVLLFTAFAAILAILAFLAGLLAGLAASGQSRLGQVLNDVAQATLVGQGPAGVFVWQVLATKLFMQQQSNSDFAAISYAVMDGHDYLEKSCTANADSIEVFFDATDPMLIAYVDALLAFEAMQEVVFQRTFVGYISLRFTGPTRALIGEQRFPRTCAIEVSGLKDVSGVTELLNQAIMLALDPNFGGILHWGQHNESLRAQVEQRFGDTPSDPTGDLHTWRQGLSTITDNGRLDGFSSAFTRQTGLEIVTPVISTLTAVGGRPQQPITVSWDASHNPPGTTISLQVLPPSGAAVSFPGLAPTGQQQATAAASLGTYTIELFATISTGGETITVVRQTTVTVSQVIP